LPFLELCSGLFVLAVLSAKELFIVIGGYDSFLFIIIAALILFAVVFFVVFLLLSNLELSCCVEHVTVGAERKINTTIIFGNHTYKI
jgi:hypothetical protein